MNKIAVQIDGQSFEVDLGLVPVNGTGLSVKVNGEPVSIILPNPTASMDEMSWMIVNDHPYEIVCDIDMQWIRSYLGLHTLAVHDLQANTIHTKSGDGRLKSPIPGQVTLILAEEGEFVRAGQPLLILEAMKMENQIRAPFDGIVEKIHVSPGQNVALKCVLLEIR